MISIPNALPAAVRQNIGTSRRGAIGKKAAFSFHRKGKDGYTLRMKPLLTCCVLAVLCVGNTVVRGEDQPAPEFGTLYGVFVGSGKHSTFVQTHLELPLFQLDALSARYRYREVTPFWRENSQTQLLYTRNELELAYRLTDVLELLAVTGQRRTTYLDRPGSLNATALGLGLGSPRSAGNTPTIEWSVTAGAYVSRQDFDDDWWFDGHAVWRFLRLSEHKTMQTIAHPSLGLAADIEASNEGGHIRGLYQIGPVLEVATANGNCARLYTRWYFADRNAFYEDRESALLLALEVASTLDKQRTFDAREHRVSGWLPLVWGQYDLGWGGDRSLQRFEANAEIHDFEIAGHRFTARLWYESRQEYRPGDFDNISYSVAIGPQTEIGLESVLSQGQPLVLGCDYLHRSAHALSPDASRVTPGVLLERNSVNIGPHLRLQTRGWDLPYRDPSIYVCETRWLAQFDWRVTAGYDFNSSRDRDKLAAQLGLNCDVAAIRGFVIYARGIGSLGNETPDWLAEIGVRRPSGSVFLRAERYGLESHIARGTALVAGVGFNL